MGVPHDAIERLSYLVQVRRSMNQKAPSDLSVSDYRRNALRRFSNIVRCGDYMSSVEHSALHCMFGAERRTAKACLKLSIPRMLWPLLEEFDPARRPLLFCREF